MYNSEKQSQLPTFIPRELSRQPLCHTSCLQDSRNRLLNNVNSVRMARFLRVILATGSGTEFK